MSYYDAEREGVKVAEIQTNSVYFYKDSFHVKIDDIAFKSKTMDTLKAKARKLTRNPVKAIRFYISLHSDPLDVLNVVKYSSQRVYRVDEAGKKRRMRGGSLYVHTPELEEDLRTFLERAIKLRKDIDEALRKVQRI